MDSPKGQWFGANVIFMSVLVKCWTNSRVVGNLRRSFDATNKLEIITCNFVINASMIKWLALEGGYLIFILNINWTETYHDKISLPQYSYVRYSICDLQWYVRVCAWYSIRKIQDGINGYRKYATLKWTKFWSNNWFPKALTKLSMWDECHPLFYQTSS